MDSKAELIVSLIKKGLTPEEAGKASATFFEEWKPVSIISKTSNSVRICHLCFDSKCTNIGSCKELKRDVDYKRKICWYSLFGKCSKGSGCSYAHSLEELEIYNIELALEISQKIEDISTGKIPSSKVSKYKTEVCRFYKNCNRGTSCDFAHSIEERNHHRDSNSKDILIDNILKSNCCLS